jgi:hypothetical protein
MQSKFYVNHLEQLYAINLIGLRFSLYCSVENSNKPNFGVINYKIP